MPDTSTEALPGFEGLVPQARPGDMDLSNEQRYTGEVLFAQHPEVFKSVAAALFLDGLSIRAIAARFRVSVNSVRAIRDMAIESAKTDAGRAAFFIKSKAKKLQGIIRTRSLEVIYDRLADPKESSKIPIDTLIRLSELKPLDNADTTDPKGEVIDIEEFEDVVNGLNTQKKSAPESATSNDSLTPVECSTSNANSNQDSVELSGSNQ